MPDPVERPASYEEIIQHLAKKSGVSPTLALSVAETESAFNPAAVSPKGAKGLFQLMPDTAAEMGVVDQDDAIQNINGGLKYLKTLDTRYKGDVNKILAAYNAGPTAVDAGGDLPAETQAYIGKVLGSLSKRQRTATQPTATAAAPTVPAAAPTATPEAPKPGLLRRIAAGFDPRTEEGAGNVGATAGAVVGGIPGAAVGGAAGRGIQQLVSNATELPGAVADITRNVIGGHGAETASGFAEGAGQGAAASGIEAAKQAAYEVGGRLMAWPIIKGGKHLLATGVAKRASAALRGGLETASTTAKGLLETARANAKLGRETAADAASEAVASTRDAMGSFMDDVKATAAKGVQKAKDLRSGGVATAKAQSADVLAQADLDAADLRRVAQAGYDTALGQTPDRAAVGQASKDVLSGLPGVGGGNGPAKRALDAAGKAIDTAAESGPKIKSAPIQKALEEMRTKSRPDSLFQGAEPKTPPGFTQPTIQAASSSGGQRTAAKATNPTANTISIDEYKRLTGQNAVEMGVPETHPLPGVLAQIQMAPENLSFKDAHQLKRLLDEAVSWDRTAKKHLEGLTKGVRTTLRQALSVHEPYNEATRAYSELVPIYRRGAGKALVKAAGERPDRIAKMLNPANPHDAAQMRSLLVDQAASGGDPAAGQTAWDHVRSAFTYDKLLVGGPEKLSERVTKLETQSPEFVKTLFGDDSGQMVLRNMKDLGAAFDQAAAQGGEKVAMAKTAGTMAKDQAAAEGAAGVSAARTKAAQDVATASKSARAAVQSRRIAAKQDVAAATHAGATEIKTARETGKSAVDLAKEELTKFQNSTMAPFARRENTTGADLLRSGMGGYFGALSIMRLLRAPKGEDLLRAAAYSPEMTQRMVRVLTGKAPRTATTTLLRDLVGIAESETEQKPASNSGELHLTIR